MVDAQQPPTGMSDHWCGLDKESYTIYRSLEGKQFELDAFAHYKTLCCDDPIPPVRANTIPKSELVKLWQRKEGGDDTTTTLLPFHGEGGDGISHRKGFDIVRFRASGVNTNLTMDGDNVPFLTPIPVECKLNPSDAQLTSTVHEFLKTWQHGPHWGNLEPHVELILPDLARPDFVTIERDWKKVQDDTGHFKNALGIDVRVTRVPYTPRDPSQVLALRKSTFEASDKVKDVLCPRPWIVDTIPKCHHAWFVEGHRVVKVMSAVGSAKTAFCYKVAERREFWVSFCIFPRVELADKMYRNYLAEDPHAKIFHHKNSSVVTEALRHHIQQLERSGHASTGHMERILLCTHTLRENLHDTVVPFVKRHPMVFFSFPIDEAHFDASLEVMQTLRTLPNVKIVLVTATMPESWVCFDDDVALKKEVDEAPLFLGESWLQSIQQGFTLAPTFRFIHTSQGGKEDVECLDYLVHESHSKNALVLCSSQEEVDRAKTLLQDMDPTLRVFQYTSDLRKPWEQREAFEAACKDPNTKNVLVCIFMCDMGVDFPAVDTVVYLRSFESKHVHLHPWQALEQRQRMTRAHKHKTLCEFVLPNNPKNVQVVGQWFARRDPEMKVAKVVTYTKTSDHCPRLVHFVPFYDATLKHSLSKTIEAPDLTEKEKDVVVRAFCKNFAYETRSTRGGQWMENVTFRVPLESGDRHFAARPWFQTILRLWRESKLSSDTKTAVEDCPWLLPQLEKKLPNLVGLKSVPPHYEVLRRTQLPQNHYPLNEIIKFYEDVCLKGDDADVGTGEHAGLKKHPNILAILTPGVTSYEFKLGCKGRLSEQDQSTVRKNETTGEVFVTVQIPDFTMQSDVYEMYDTCNTLVGDKDTGNGPLRSAVTKVQRYQHVLLHGIKWVPTMRQACQEHECKDPHARAFLEACEPCVLFDLHRIPDAKLHDFFLLQEDGTPDDILAHTIAKDIVQRALEMAATTTTMTTTTPSPLLPPPPNPHPSSLSRLKKRDKGMADRTTNKSLKRSANDVAVASSTPPAPPCGGIFLQLVRIDEDGTQCWAFCMGPPSSPGRYLHDVALPSDAPAFLHLSFGQYARSRLGLGPGSSHDVTVPAPQLPGFLSDFIDLLKTISLDKTVVKTASGVAFRPTRSSDHDIDWAWLQQRIHEVKRWNEWAPKVRAMKARVANHGCKKNNTNDVP